MLDTARARCKKRIRKTLSGSPQRPRLTVYKSLRSLYFQVIDDTKGVTLCSGLVKGSKNKEAGEKLGQQVVEKVKEKGLVSLVFDRNAYRYHGVIAVIVEMVRKGGIAV